MANKGRLSDSTGLHSIPLPNGVKPLTITEWKNWTQWQVSVDDLEKITGYDLFSNLSTEVQQQLEARREDRFIGGVPLLASDEPLQSLEFFSLQPGESVNRSIWQSDSDGKLLINIGNITSSSEVDINKIIVSNNNILQISSSEGGFPETSKTPIRSLERGIIQVTPIKVSPNQDAIVKVGSPQVGIYESSPIQISPSKTSSFQVGIVEHNVVKVSPSEVSIYQNNSSQIQVVQTGTAPINSGEVSLSSLEPFFQLFSIHDSIPQIINSGKILAI